MPEIYFWRHLAWKAESLLSEDELSRKVLGPAVYTKIYCRVQRNRVLFIPVQWEKSGHTDHEANRGGSAVPHDKAVALAACRQPGRCRRIPYIGSERKNSVRKTGERYKHCMAWGRLTIKRCGRESTGRLYGRGTNPCVTCWKVPYIGPERGKLREVNPVSTINTDEEKSGKRRAEARGNSAPLPHMAHSPRILSGSSQVPGHWEAKSSAVPRGWT